MEDINVIVASNIIDLMKKNKTKQIDLAETIGVSKQIMSKMLNGSRMISIADLMNAPTESNSDNVVRAFMGKVNTEAAKEALQDVDELADMIIYHAKVRENAKIMSGTWEM